MQSERPDWISELDDADDVALEVHAATREQLVERAALATFWVIASVDPVRAREPTSFCVEASDFASLLRRWVARLNAVHSDENRLFRRVDVAPIRDTGDGLVLKATGHGEPIDRSRHTLYSEIRHVNVADVSPNGSGWAALLSFEM